MQNDTATVAVVDTADNNQNDSTTNTAPAQKRKVGRPPNKPDTKLAKAKALFPALVEASLTRSQILDAFEQEIGCKRGTAQVYFHEAKKAHPGLTVARKPKATTVAVADASQVDADAETAG